MKFLLTSSGISNRALLNSLLNLAGKPVNQLKVVYIPTAANVEPGDKGWLIDNLRDFQEAGFESVDIMDIAAVPLEIWKPRLEAADILVMGGGNTSYLLEQIHSSGLAEVLPELLKTRVYLGTSAGSMVVGTDMPAEALEMVYPDESTKGEKGLRLVDFYILPHFGSEYFPEVHEKNAQKVADISRQTVYLLDDQTGIEVNGDSITVIGEGTCIRYER
ncbi:MAG: Type 1 glutamine amidotransferase-like domain-containing protein [bacterium]